MAPRPALAADNQPGVEVVGDLINRLGHRFARLDDMCDGVVTTRSSSRRPLLGDLLSGSGFLLIDLALVRYGHDERAGSGQLDGRGRPYRQHHGIGGFDPLGCGSQRGP